MRDNVGDMSIGVAIVRHGYSSPPALMALLNEIHLAKIKAASQPPACTKKSNPDLAAAAHAARQAFLDGKKLAHRTYCTLNREEVALHEKYVNQSLQRDMIAANKAYGHGRGSAIKPSIEQMAALGASKRGVH